MAKKKSKKRRRKRKSIPETAPIDSLGRKKINGIDFYQVENALETLTRANEIQLDEKLMQATDKLLKKRQDAMDKVEKQIKRRK